jgi:signal transduction histidine kinase
VEAELHTKTLVVNSMPAFEKHIATGNPRSPGTFSPRRWAKDIFEMQEQERRRISQELHDDLGQRLALLEIKIDQLENKCPIGDVTNGLKVLKSLIAEMDENMHRICYELYPVVLEQMGLIQALTALCRDFSESSGIAVTFEHSNIPGKPSKTVSLCLYRVVQEALHNVAKHARAKDARITLRSTYEGLEAKIIDSGVGFDRVQAGAAKGLGLTTIRERIRSIGGRCWILSSPGVGTAVKALIYRHC